MAKGCCFFESRRQGEDHFTVSGKIRILGHCEWQKKMHLRVSVQFAASAVFQCQSAGNDNTAGDIFRDLKMVMPLQTSSGLEYWALSLE